MESYLPFIKFTLDEDSLREYLKLHNKKVEDSLAEHGKEIVNIKSLLGQKVLPGDSKSDFNQKIINRLDTLENLLQKKIKELEDKLNDHLSKSKEGGFGFDGDNGFDGEGGQGQNAEKFDPEGILNEVKKVDQKLDSKVALLENEIEKNANKNKKFIQALANAVALFGNTSPALDDHLDEEMQQSVQSILFVIDSLKKDNEKLKSKLKKRKEGEKALNLLVDKMGKTQWSGPKPERKPFKKKKGSIQKTFELNIPDSGMSGGGLWVDFGGLNLYQQPDFSWKNPPLLPEIEKFGKMEKMIDYTYKLHPSLQAILNAFYYKLVEHDAELMNRANRDGVEQTFEKFRNVIQGLVQRLNDLNDILGETASRKEINSIIEDILRSMHGMSETAVGSVKCIACGRDISKVVGSAPETDTIRVLGSPPYSMAFNAPNKYGSISVRFAGTEEMNSSIVEQPKSLKPIKPVVLSARQKGTVP